MASSPAEAGSARPGFCYRPAMDDPPRHEPPIDHMVRAVTRVDAAMARVSRTEALLTDAMERLALARLALEDTSARGIHTPLWDGPVERNGHEEDDPRVA
jgi:hypothetical protein